MKKMFLLLSLFSFLFLFNIQSMEESVKNAQLDPKTLKTQLTEQLAVWKSQSSCSENKDDSQAVDVVLGLVKKGGPDFGDYRSIQHIIKFDKYAPLLEFMLKSKMISNDSKVFRPSTFLDLTAISAGALQNAELLLQFGADPNIRMGSTGCAEDDHFIHGVAWATEYGSEAVAKLLLRYGANANIDSEDENALVAFTKSFRAKDELLNMLLEHGADPHLILKTKKTPYDIAQGHAKQYPNCARYQLCVDTFNKVRPIQSVPVNNRSQS